MGGRGGVGLSMIGRQDEWTVVRSGDRKGWQGRQWCLLVFPAGEWVSGEDRDKESESQQRSEISKEDGRQRGRERSKYEVSQVRE